MRWKVLLAAVTLGLGLYFVVSTLITGEKPELTEGKTPVEILREVKKSKGISNFKYRADVGAGDNITVDITGKVSPGTKEELVNFSWDSPQGYGEASAYIKGEKTLVFHPLKNQWFSPEDDKALGPVIKLLSSQLALVNPYRSLDKINFNEVKAENTGTEKVNGVETTVVEVEPGTKAGEWLKGLLPPQLIGARVSEVKQIYWIGNTDLRIRKYLMTAKIKILGLQIFEFKVSTNVEGFNETELKLPDTLRDLQSS